LLIGVEKLLRKSVKIIQDHW